MIVLRVVPAVRIQMDNVLQDYFWYYRGMHYENGTQVRDMLVFRYDLSMIDN